jgi:two-component system, chemotaxis family, chemotaxis protein CheY
MSLNIMVVDDSAVARAMIIKVLKLSGLPVGEILQASNGQEGLQLMEDHWVDLLLVDINMPVMTGEEMIQRIRAVEAWQDLPIIIISTEGSVTRIERLQQQGASFVHKPFTPEMINEIVGQLTGVSQ